MVGQGRRENSQDHRNRTPVARARMSARSRLVAHLCEDDDSGETRNASRFFSAVSRIYPFREIRALARRRRSEPAESAGGRDLSRSNEEACL